VIRLLVHRLLLLCIGAFVAMAALERAEPTPPPLLIRADYQRCVQFTPGH
jgi:hypothetical protein